MWARGKFFETTPFRSLVTLLLYKLNSSNDDEKFIFRCLIDEEDYLKFLSA